MKVFLSILLLISLAGNAYLFLNPREKILIKQEMPKEETEKIREVSLLCGLDSENYEQTSVLSNLSDIKTCLWNNTKTCDIDPITPEEIEILEVFLSNRPSILSKIQAQNAFIAPYSMKKIIILPVNE